MFHVANTLLLFIVLKKMSGTVWQAAFVSALFALHPLHVESVAWVAERKDVLSTFFWMLTMWTYVRYVEYPKLSRYLLVLLSLALGLMSKPMLVTLPFVLLLIDYWPLGRFWGERPGDVIISENHKPKDRSQQWSDPFRLVREKVPLFALSAASSVVTGFSQHSGGATSSLDVLPLKIRIGNALVSYVAYAGKMIWPKGLAVIYPYPAGEFTAWKVAGATILLICISALAIRAARRRPYLAVGWLWYLGTLVPVIGLVQVGSQSMADRYTYVPLIGLFIIIAWGVADLLAGWRYRRIVLATSAGALLLAFMVCTSLQVSYWRDSFVLFGHAIEVTANNPVAHYNLGHAMAKQGNLNEAIGHYSKALQGDPNLKQAHNNLGVALYKQGKVDEAITHFNEALRIAPDYAEAHYSLGMTLAEEGKLQEAISYYSRALQARPNYAEVYNDLGVALARQGKLDEAISHHSKALQIRPDYPEAYNDLGIALARQGKSDEAISYYSRALQIKPDHAEAHNNLAFELARQGNLRVAISHYFEAVKIKPDYASAHNNLANALAEQGKLEEAVSHYLRAVQIRPSFAEAYNNLGIALASQGNLEEAIGHFTEALQIRADYAEAHNNLGVALARQGKSDQAIAHFSEAVKIKPDYAQASNNLRALRRARKPGTLPTTRAGQ
jgi:tetratricopeptide (TPR) repeat protein